jgi:hypothetical protein
MVGARLVSRLRPRAAPKAPHLAAIAEAKQALHDLAQLPGRIIVGPWHAEVGYEVLYWVPFLRWALEREPGLAGRLVVVSRGGTRSWYEGIASDYVDLYDHRDPDSLLEELDRVRAETGLSHKQKAETALDRELVAAAETQVGAAAGVLHPALMFGILEQLVKRQLPRQKEMPLRFARLTPPPLPPSVRLPERFVAVRFYSRISFPASAENRDLVAATLAGIADTMDVVLLDPGTRYDDHEDFAIAAGERIHRVVVGVDAAANLALQTAVLARAEAFVGTYGGLSYLPPFLGVPSLALYSDAHFLPHHVELANRVFSQSEYAPFVALRTDALDLLRLAIPSGDAAAVKKADATLAAP